MFAQIKTVVDIISGGFKGIREFKTKRDRDKAIQEMLLFYFVLKDCVDEGESLIVEAGSNPVAKIKAMPRAEAKATVARWDAALRRQGLRLRALEGMLYGQSQLAVISPDLENALTKAIGYKMDRTVTLHGIGAGLFLRCMFPLNATEAEKAQLIFVMAGERARRAIDLERIHGEVRNLRKSLEEYRVLVQRLASDEEILRLSNKARKVSRMRVEASTLRWSGPPQAPSAELKHWTKIK